MLTNQLYDFYVGVPISRLLTVGSTPVQHSVLIVSSNQEKALVGASSVIVKLRVHSDNLSLKLPAHHLAPVLWVALLGAFNPISFDHFID